MRVSHLGSILNTALAYGFFFALSAFAQDPLNTTPLDAPKIALPADFPADALVTPQTFLQEHTDRGQTYHTARSINSAASIIKSGFYFSHYAFSGRDGGRGAFTAQDLDYAVPSNPHPYDPRYSGHDQTLVIRYQHLEQARILDYQKFAESKFGADLLKRHRGNAAEVMRELTEKCGIHIFLKSEQVILTDNTYIDYPKSLADLRARQEDVVANSSRQTLDRRIKLFYQAQQVTERPELNQNYGPFMEELDRDILTRPRSDHVGVRLRLAAQGYPITQPDFLQNVLVEIKKSNSSGLSLRLAWELADGRVTLGALIAPAETQPACLEGLLSVLEEYAFRYDRPFPIEKADADKIARFLDYPDSRKVVLKILEPYLSAYKPQLVRLAGDPDPEVRRLAVRGLESHIKSDDADLVEPLATLIRSTKIREERQALAKLLVRIDSNLTAPQARTKTSALNRLTVTGLRGVWNCAVDVARRVKKNPYYPY